MKLASSCETPIYSLDLRRVYSNPRTSVLDLARVSTNGIHRIGQIAAHCRPKSPTPRGFVPSEVNLDDLDLVALGKLSASGQNFPRRRVISAHQSREGGEGIGNRDLWLDGPP